mgnify:CR=1 FL=1
MNIDLIRGEAWADQQCVSLNYNMILLETLSILCENKSYVEQRVWPILYVGCLVQHKFYDAAMNHYKGSLADDLFRKIP